MSTVNLTAENFESTLKDNDIVFIDFWAEWCGPCRMFSPIYDKVAEKYPDIKFTKVNTEAEQDLALSFGIQSIPTLAIFRDRILLFKQPGLLPEAALEDVIKQVKQLNMDDIRAQIAKESEQTDSQAKAA